MKTNSIAGKAIVNIPAWAEAYNNGELMTHEVTGSESAYASVPLLYRAVRLRCDALASTPMTIMQGESEVEWPFEADLYSLIWQTEAALLLTGYAFWLKLSNRVVTKTIQWINPLTMDVKWIRPVIDGKGQVIEPGRYEFSQGSGDAIRTFKPDEIMYFREFNLGDEVGKGISSSAVALGDAKLLNYINLFAGKFFQGGAMPVTMLGIEGLTDPDEIKRLEGKFKQLMTGIRNAFRVLAVSKAITPAVITPPLNTMSFPELTESSTRSIAHAFGLPVNMLLGDDNYASASEHRLSFFEDTIRPRYSMYEGVINRDPMMKKQGYTLKFNFEQMDIYQRDVLESASALGSLVTAGIPLGMACETLGIELPEGVEYDDLDRLQEEKRQQDQEQAQAQAQSKFGKSRKYSADQPRVPTGDSEGGQWTSDSSMQIDLTEGEKEHLTAYAEFRFTEINGVARGEIEAPSSNEKLEVIPKKFDDPFGDLLGMSDLPSEDGMDPFYFDVNSAITNIDSAIEKAPGFIENATVYRGFGSEEIFTEIKNGELQSGDIFQDKGFMSTSTRFVTAQNFSSKSYPVLLEIHAEKGARAINVGPNIIRQGFKSESEMLLPRNSSLLITSANIIRNESGREVAKIIARYK